ncbi:MAG: alpha-glucosidase/alpha-galactosidase [Kiritimatiellae bacterium]|nr:alpha-glucosidase/alpha-galactosidase [Kiritimatiellia bacterium]
MSKITFMGAGSTVFAKNVLGDSMLCDALCRSDIALYDIDRVRLNESKRMLDTINRNVNQGRAKIKAYLGVDKRRQALDGADFVINAIQVGGYDPCTITDFEVPKKYGLRQTIADTLGIGGIFRTLRTLPVMLDFAHDVEKVAPKAWFLNYTNPMAMLTGGLLRGSSVKAVGLCHSVQVCASSLLQSLGLDKKYPPQEVVQYTAGINHMAWLLKIEHKGRDLYPEIKALAEKKLKQWRKAKDPKDKHWNMVRLEMMLRIGYYITESSEHFSEYCVHFIKNAAPELVPEFNIPLDEYPRRCVNQIEGWKKMSKELVGSPDLKHSRSHEYASYIMEAIATDKPTRIGGNVINHGLIPNLPPEACVEVPCLVDGNGVQGCYVGNLPEVCASYNRTNINVQLMTIEAVLTRRRECIYQAAMLDPHTAGELTIDQIRAMCDDLIEAHGDWLPKFR